jgi:hypothetical protein
MFPNFFTAGFIKERIERVLVKTAHLSGAPRPRRNHRRNLRATFRVFGNG